MALATYAHFADRDPLTRVVLEQMLAGVSTRRFARTKEPVGQDVLGVERSTSKSAVSREFVGRTGEHLRALMSRPLGDTRLAALMLDGIELKGRCCVVCLGVTTDGIKVPLGLWDGSTENKTVTAHLREDRSGWPDAPSHSRSPSRRRNPRVGRPSAAPSRLECRGRWSLNPGSANPGRELAGAQPRRRGRYLASPLTRRRAATHHLRDRAGVRLARPSNSGYWLAYKRQDRSLRWRPPCPRQGPAPAVEAYGVATIFRAEVPPRAPAPLPSAARQASAKMAAFRTRRHPSDSGWLSVPVPAPPLRPATTHPPRCGCSGLRRALYTSHM